jgi:hypothetical protein
MWRSEFNKYLKLAFKHKIVNNNLKKRLSSNKFDEFLQAHQELMTAYFLEKILSFDLEFHPQGEDASILDFQLNLAKKERILVEVKAPLRETPKHVWMGTDEKVIKQNLKAARKQIPKNELSLIILAPLLKSPIGSKGSGIFEALYGQDRVLVKMVSDPSKNGSTEWRLDPCGFFQPTSNTRIGAVATLENSIVPPEWIHKLVESNFDKNVISQTDFKWKTLFQYIFKVFHNPYAKKSIDSDLFKPYPQFVKNSDETKMEWINEDYKVIQNQ